MVSVQEVILTTEGTDIRWNACMWDVQNGNTLMTFKGGCSSRHCLDILANDYIVSGLTSKPIIHIWPIQTQYAKEHRIICSGKVSAIATSPCGDYIVVAIENKIHVWQVCTGNLMAVIKRHYLDVTTIKFSDIGDWFVTAGKDNQIMVWMLDRVLCPENYDSPEIEAKHTWTQHCLDITDLFIEKGQPNALILSTSLDQTCKIFDFISGQMICSIVFDTGVSAVTMDCIGHAVYVGDIKGNIFKLFKNQMLACSDQPEKIERNIFKGHSDTVTCLALTSNGALLVSGSNDQTARIWETESGHCIRVMNHKGAVVNVLTLSAPVYLYDPDYQPKMIIGDFQRHLWDKSKPYFIPIRKQPNHINMSECHSEARAFIIDCLRKDKEGVANSDSVIQSSEIINQIDVKSSEEAENLKEKLKLEIEENKNLKQKNFNLMSILARNWKAEVEHS